MNFDRAQQIINSSENIDVTYNGREVWIDNLNPSNNTAQVKLPVNSNNVIEVPLDKLNERGLQ